MMQFAAYGVLIQKQFIVALSQIGELALILLIYFHIRLDLKKTFNDYYFPQYISSHFANTSPSYMT